MGQTGLKSQVQAVGALPELLDAVSSGKADIAALEAGTARAVLYAAPVLVYCAAHAGKGRVETVGTIFRPENYGILFPEGSSYRRQVNAALLKLTGGGEYRALYRKWFMVEAASDT